MAIKKIPCGGWLYDDEQITFEDGVMKVIGGGIPEAPIDGKQYARKDAEWSEVQSGGGGGAMIVKVTADSETFALSADKTFAEIKEAYNAGVNVVAKLYIGEEYGGTSSSCISCGGITAYFGIAFIDEETLDVKYELTCRSDDGIDEWSSAAF